MKKNLIYLFSLLCSLSLFTACSDDDDKNGPDEPTPTTWKDYAATYGEKNSLILNGADFATGSNFAVTVAEGSNDKAKIILSNLYPEATHLELDDIDMIEKDDAYAFSGETEIAESVITITGTLTPGTITKALSEKPAQLSINTTRKIKSDIVGNWWLNFVPSADQSSTIADVYFNLKTNDSGLDFLLSMGVPAAVGKLISDKVDRVNIQFNENGIFDFSWRPVGATAFIRLMDIIHSFPQMAGFADQIEGLVEISYFVKDDVIYLALNKQLPALLSAMQGIIPVDVTEIFASLLETKVLIDQSNYYLLPISIKSEDYHRFIMGIDKQITLPLLHMVLAMLNWEELKDLPSVEPYKDMIEAAIAALPTAETFDIGLGFLKEQSLDF